MSITNLQCLGVCDAGQVAASGVTGMCSAFSWTPATGAWDYKIVITGSGADSAYTYTAPIISPWSGNPGAYIINNGLQGCAFVNDSAKTLVRGVTYTATLTFSTVKPTAGYTPSYSGSVTVTFSLGATTVGICPLLPAGDQSTGLIRLLVDKGAQSSATSVTVTCTQSIPSVTRLFGTAGSVFVTLATTAGRFDPTLSYTATAAVSGATNGTYSFYGPIQQNTFGTPTVGATSITVPWTPGVGTGTSAAKPFQTWMLYNDTTGAWVSTAVLSATTATVTISSGITNGNSYILYLWPMNSNGINGTDNGHYLTFVAGGSGTAAQFGINGWFFSPLQA